MNAWSKVQSGDYAEAVNAFTEEIERSPSTFLHNNRGMAYLHLGMYDAALEDFQSAEASGSNLSHPASDGLRSGVALWMAGRHQDAIATWSAGVDARLAGEVQYGDAAGGVTVGNLLFFGGVRLRLGDAVSAATRLLRKRLRTKQSLAWPGPTSRYLLGMISESAMLADVSATPILRERQLCQATFYRGVRALSAGDMTEYLMAMREASKLGLVAKLEVEYYLAFHEESLHNQKQAEQG